MWVFFLSGVLGSLTQFVTSYFPYYPQQLIRFCVQCPTIYFNNLCMIELQTLVSKPVADFFNESQRPNPIRTMSNSNKVFLLMRISILLYLIVNHMNDQTSYILLMFISTINMVFNPIVTTRTKGIFNKINNIIEKSFRVGKKVTQTLTSSFNYVFSGVLLYFIDMFDKFLTWIDTHADKVAEDYGIRLPPIENDK